MGFKWIILLICSIYAVTSYEFTLRPIYGNQNEGYVELRVNGTWGIMSGFFNHLDDIFARILCRSLGFGLTGFSTSSLVDLELSHNALLWDKVIQCNGSERDAAECVKGTWPNTGHWSSTFPRGWTRLHCFAYEITDMRIYGGLLPHVGRLEVKVGSRWGRVCTYPNGPSRHGRSTFGSHYANGGWCSVLGYAGYSPGITLPPANEQPATEAWMLFRGCDSDATSMNDCSFMKGVDYPCTLSIHVNCGPVQLVNGTSPNSGIIQAGMFGQLQMFCAASDFTVELANITCDLLGYQSVGKISAVKLAVGNADVVFSGSIQCNGTEQSLEMCDVVQEQYDCQDSSVVYIECSECPLGKFGTNCTECSCNNRSTGPCDTETGECTCKTGWSGTSCELDIDECVTPTVCPNNSDCTNVPGSYHCVCRPGFTLTGRFCSGHLYTEETEPKSNLLVIILSSVIGGLALLSIIAIFCMCKYRMKGQENTPDTVDATTTSTPSNEYKLSSTNKSEDYSTIDDRSLHTGRCLTNTESIKDPYNTINDDIRGSPGLNKININNKDTKPMADKKDSEYPYPSVLPTDGDGYLKVGKYN